MAGTLEGIIGFSRADGSASWSFCSGAWGVLSPNPRPSGITTSPTTDSVRRGFKFRFSLALISFFSRTFMNCSLPWPRVVLKLCIPFLTVSENEVLLLSPDVSWLPFDHSTSRPLPLASCSLFLSSVLKRFNHPVLFLCIGLSGMSSESVDSSSSPWLIVDALPYSSISSPTSPSTFFVSLRSGDSIGEGVFDPAFLKGATYEGMV